MSTVIDDDLRRRLAVAKDYEGMMGLSTSLLGAFLLVQALTDSPWAMLLLAVSWLPRLWYRGRFGNVVTGSRKWSGRAVVAMLGFIVAVVVTVAAVPADRPALQGLGLAVALALGCWSNTPNSGLTRWHWLALLVLALWAPVAALTHHTSTRDELMAVAGGCLVVIGLVDHRRLVDTLGAGAAG